MSAPAPHLLFVVLDWGLGHATRTLPLIEESAKTMRVTVASSGPALSWLRKHSSTFKFGTNAINCFEKPGTEVRYNARGGLLGQFTIASQLPRFVRSARLEQQWIQAFCAQHGITHIVSDNCYGAWTPDLPCAIITHQLNPAVPHVLRPFSRRLIHRMLRPFKEIWIPDQAANESHFTRGGLLTGPMAAPLPSDAPRSKFLGPISRFGATKAGESCEAGDVKFPLVASVSGPAPHREKMETIVRSIFQRDGRPALILAGRPQYAQPSTTAQPTSPEPAQRVDLNVTTLYDATSTELQAAFQQADVLICRSGYSTLMDLVALRTQAILVPTPGQPEQLQLAKMWGNEFNWPTCLQHQLEDLHLEDCSPRTKRQDFESSPIDHYTPNFSRTLLDFSEMHSKNTLE
ncbi:MAG: glycosyltransferase [Flavobacteriales bacterium]|nr:glycosyltransferase [Flavobacteriales bacterium]